MKILLADDHIIVRDGIGRLLTGAYPFAQISTASNTAQLFAMLGLEKWDVIISDISMPPGDSGLESIRLIRQQLPKTPVIILSMHPVEQYAVRAIKAGASGYLTKGEAAHELVKAVNHVLSGKRYLGAEVALAMADTISNSDDTYSVDKLSDRELEVFKMLASGIQVSTIAKELRLSSNTISTFRSKIFEKMGFSGDVDLIKYAVHHKFV